MTDLTQDWKRVDLPSFDANEMLNLSCIDQMQKIYEPIKPPPIRNYHAENLEELIRQTELSRQQSVRIEELVRQGESRETQVAELLSQNDELININNTLKSKNQEYFDIISKLREDVETINSKINAPKKWYQKIHIAVWAIIAVGFSGTFVPVDLWLWKFIFDS